MTQPTTTQLLRPLAGESSLASLLNSAVETLRAELAAADDLALAEARFELRVSWKPVGEKSSEDSAEVNRTYVCPE